MHTDIDLSIVIPAFNEANRIYSTLQKIDNFFAGRKQTVEVIVVDDGSSDKTEEQANSFTPSSFTLHLLKHDRNRGKAAALQTGVSKSSGNLILASDADLSTPICEIDKLLNVLLAGGFDIAIGSRALKCSQVEVHQPLYRELLGKSFNLLAQILATPGIWDTQCGFKLFRSEAGKRVFAKMTVFDFAFDVEILAIAEKTGYKTVEIPIRWKNSPETKLNLIRDIPLMFFSLLRIFFNKSTGKYKE